MKNDIKPKATDSNSPRILSIGPSLDKNWIIQNSSSFTDKKGDLVLDFSKTNRIDSSGTCFLQLMHRDFKEAGARLIIRNISDELYKNIRSWGSIAKVTPVEADTETNVAVRLGLHTVAIKVEIEKALSILTEMIYWGTIGLLKKRDFRKGILGEQMYLLGFKALGIVSLLSLLIGIVLSYQSAVQLETFGAGVFLAPLMGKSMVRELGPLLTAIILAGRSGSATTAEIATMMVGEEIDALKTMGINPVQFVVVPKFWAISITMPTLSLISTAAGIFGGFIIATLYLNLSAGMYLSDMGQWVTFKDVAVGVSKSIVFSWLIIWIGACYGFRVHGGAEAVGKETTASVVAGIFSIIIADAAFSFV